MCDRMARTDAASMLAAGSIERFLSKHDPVYLVGDNLVAAGNPCGTPGNLLAHGRDMARKAVVPASCS